MIKFDIRAHIDAMEGLYELQKVLDREQDRQLEAVARVRKTWKGTTAETFQVSYETMLLDGIYNDALQQVRGMYNTMAYALPEMEYLKNKCENFHTYLSGEPYERWSLGAYRTPSSQLMSDSAAISTMCTYLENISASNHGACDALSDLMDACGGLIDFSEEEVALRRAREKADRVLILRDELNSYARRMEALDDELSRDFAQWVDTDILSKIDASNKLQSTSAGDSVKAIQQVASCPELSQTSILYLAQTYGVSTTASDINWEEIALAAYADILNKTDKLTLVEKEILSWGESQFALYDICVNGTDQQRQEQTVALLGKDNWTKIELTVLCACLDSYASLRDHEKLQELGSSLLKITYETRQNVNGDITLYTVSVDDEKLQTLLEGAQNLGAANLYSYLSAFEGIRIPQVQTKDAQECHFFFDMIDGKDGVCEFALCIESDLEGGQVAMGYQSDMGVSQLTEEELRKVNSGLENHPFYERWLDGSKEEEYCYKQRIEDVLRRINRANIAQVIEENGMAEYLPYLYGDIPYLDAEGEAEWNEKRRLAFEKEEEWKRQGIDVNAVENYYYYLCGLETIAASAMRAEGDGFGSSLESFVLKYIGNMASNAYEQVCYITGTTIDKDIAWYVPEKKAEAIRTTVAGNIQENIGGTAGELLGKTYQGVMSLGDGAISIGMDAIIGASIAEVFSGVGKVSKVYKTTTAKEATEELVEDTVQRTIQKNVKANFENEIPYDGNDWYEYLKKLYGDDNVVWESKGGTGSKFQEVFDLADNYTLSDDTFNSHILDRHGPNSTYGNKSHFNADFDIRDGIDSTLRGDNFVVGPNTAGREGYIFEQTFTNPIGTNSKGKPLYTLKVVIDEAGNVITAFPKK